MSQCKREELGCLFPSVISVFVAQYLWRSIGLVAPWHVEHSRTRDRTHIPCIGRQILIHCTIREVQASLIGCFQTRESIPGSHSAGPRKCHLQEHPLPSPPRQPQDQDKSSKAPSYDSGLSSTSPHAFS